MSEEKPERIDAYLVAGGRYHDIDYARLELLKLLAEHPYIKLKVGYTLFYHLVCLNRQFSITFLTRKKKFSIKIFGRWFKF